MIDYDKISAEAAVVALSSLGESGGWRIRSGEDFTYGVLTKFWELANSGAGQSVRLDSDGRSFWVSSADARGEIVGEFWGTHTPALLAEILKKVAVREFVRTRRGVAVKIGRKIFDFNEFETGRS